MAEQHRRRATDALQDRIEHLVEDIYTQGYKDGRSDESGNNDRDGMDKHARNQASADIHSLLGILIHTDRRR